MSVEVYKVGGEVSGDPESFKELAHKIQRESSNIVVVTSAPVNNGQRVTDLLRQGSQGREIANIYNRIAEPFGETFNPRDFWAGLSRAETLDDKVYRGDAYQAKLTARILRRLGVDAQWVDAHDVIKTDSNFGDGKVVDVNTEPFNEKPVYVIGGFHGSNYRGQTVLLPSNGSDITAAKIAEKLNASELRIFKRQPGIRFVDPKFIPETPIVENLSYQQLRELAYRSGNAGIHPSALGSCYRLDKPNIPIFITSLTDSETTHVTASPSSHPIAGFALKEGFLIYRFDRADEPDFFRDIFDLFNQEGVSLDMVESDSYGVSIAVHRDQFAQRADLKEFQKRLERRVDNLETRGNQALVSVVGGQIYDPLIVRNFFSAFEPTEIYGIMTGNSVPGVIYLDIGKLGMNEERGYSKRLFDFFREQGTPIVSASTGIDTFSIGIRGDPVHLDDLCFDLIEEKLAETTTYSNGYKLGGRTRNLSNVTLAFPEAHARDKLREIYGACEREGFIPKLF